MKIRRLEIIGFKSFMERTKLRYDDGITGIVGPNGCGKSNIVDAIRWVMGEQSARMLRGKAMEDIIFAGSESKPPMGMAEVLITFENDGRNAPPEYASYSEITVGRRLFRSGESEYSINRTPCRLLDVQELFMGTGVGTKAYSIIGQGQIGMLVTQKPQERRALIEEAAGISKYKARKRVAERKMEQTQQNLLRVNDVVAEIGRNMGSLQRQARKAARYHRLRDQLRTIELHSASHKYLELQAKARHLRGKIARLDQEELSLQGRSAHLEASVEQRRLQLLDDDRAISELQESLLSLDNQIKLDEQNIEFLGREISSLTERGQSGAREIEQLRSQHDSLGTDVSRQELDLTELGQVAENAAGLLAEREASHRQQSRSVEDIEAAIDADRLQQMRLGESSAEVRSNLSGSDQRRLDLEGRLGQAEAERAALSERLHESQDRKHHQSERLSQLRQLHGELVEKREFEENHLIELRSKATAAEAKALALREEIERKRSRLESLKEIERNYEGCLNGVRWVMQQARDDRERKDVVGLVADILQAPPQYETAVQAVLGDRLQSVVVRSHEAGLVSVDQLKRESEGRSSFIPLDLRSTRPRALVDSVQGPGVVGPMSSLVRFDQEHRQVVDYLLGDAVVVEDLATALALWSSDGHGATLVTLEGDVLEPQGVLTGGSLEGTGIHLLESKREIRELTDALRSLEAEYRMAKDMQGTLKGQIAAGEAAIDSLRQNTHDEEIRIVDQQKDLTHLHDEVKSLSGRLEELGYECQRLQSTLDETLRARERDSAMLERIGQEQSEIETRIRAARGQLQQEKRTLAELGQEATEWKIRAAATQERRDAALRNLEHLVHTRDDLAGRIERLRSDISSGNLQAAENKTRINQSQQEIAGLLTTRERLHSELAVSRDAYEKLLASAREEEVQLKDGRRSHESLAAALSESQLQLKEVDLGLEHLVSDVGRSYKQSLLDCLSIYHLLPPPGPEALEQADKLRNEIERMGDVNPNAVEQYDELRQRFDFLTTQSKDLTDSLDKLQKVIQKINRTSRKRFREAFDAINQKFQEVFPRLFNGGRAHLTLDETQDLLEAGVEIAAQPPGKKLQNIELLSGGEKALTAVALLFSIFLIKPTPFCLLDEVDAPLDDVNIDRFNAMVKEMSRGSQFIIITHNKRTMELLDRLYGVTMEEPGISTIVTVRLTDENERGELRQAG